MKPIATGNDNLSDQSKWPPELFAPNTLCYGLVRIDFDDDNTFPPSFVSFCWKGRSLPIYLRTKFTEFNHVIRVQSRMDLICMAADVCLLVLTCLCTCTACFCRNTWGRSPT